MQLISIISHSRLIGKPNSQSNIGKHKSPAQASVLHGANYCITGRVGGDHKGTTGTKSDGRLPEIITSQFPESLAPQGIAGNYRKLQMVNSGTHNPEVGGSSPPSATIKSPEILRFQDFFLHYHIHCLLSSHTDLPFHFTQGFLLRLTHSQCQVPRARYRPCTPACQKPPATALEPRSI